MRDYIAILFFHFSFIIGKILHKFIHLRPWHKICTIRNNLYSGGRSNPRKYLPHKRESQIFGVANFVFIYVTIKIRWRILDFKYTLLFINLILKGGLKWTD